VPKEWLVEAVDEITERFGGSSFETQKVEGRWLFKGEVYRDVLARLVVDVPDTLQNSAKSTMVEKVQSKVEEKA
jgi:hypothetical protein